MKVSELIFKLQGLEQDFDIKMINGNEPTIIQEEEIPHDYIIVDSSSQY